MIGANFKILFFDRPAVIAAMDAASRIALSKAGAFIRRSARSSIRKRRRVSEPGKPPSSHQGDLRKLLFFVFDRATKSVVIGPVGFSNSKIPAVLEAGGRTQIVRHTKGQRIQQTVTIAPRPYMGPALAVNRDKIAPQFKSMLKGGG